MQEHDVIEKKICKWDGEEIPGLVSVNEIKREKRTAEVPSFRRIRDVQSGIQKLPPVELKYSIEHKTKTLKYFEDYFDKDQVKDLEIIRTDAHGYEIPGSRKVYSDCECISITEPAYDAANPVYASVTVTVVPYDIIPM